MAQEHDIQLNLDAGNFAKGINQAATSLRLLETNVNSIAITLKAAFQNFTLPDLSGLKFLNNLKNIKLDLNTDKINKELDFLTDQFTLLNKEILSVQTNLGKTFQGNIIQQVATATPKTPAGGSKTTPTGGATIVNPSTPKDLNNILTGVDKLGEGVKNLGTQATKTKSLLDFLVRGFEIGLAHAVGAVSIGANVFRSLRAEITRNLAISAFGFGVQELKKSFGSVGPAATKMVGDVTAATKEVGKAGEQLELSFGQAMINTAKSAEQAGSQIQKFLGAIDFKTLGLSVGLIFIGKLLDDLADKVLIFSESLAKVSGDASLAFLQLDAVIQATGKSLDQDLGTIDQWTQKIRDLSLVSGKSQKDLAEFAVSFTQVGAAAGLNAEQLQELLRIASFTGDRFRTSAEQLNNFRNVLTGNFRPINTNIFLATDLADAIERYTNILVRSGVAQEEATKRAKSASTAERGLALLQEASIPIIKTATETTGSYTIELRKLEGAIENLKISFGRGLEGVFAGVTKTVREFVQALTSIPKPLQNVLSLLTVFSGVVLEVTGKLLKWAGILGIVLVAYRALAAAILISIPGFGTAAAAITAFLSRFILLPGELTTLSSIFAASRAAMSKWVLTLTGGTGIIRTITAVIIALSASIFGLIGRLLTLNTVLIATKFGAYVVAISLVISALDRLNKEGSITKGILAILGPEIDSLSEGFKVLANSIGLAEKAQAAYTTGVGILTTILRVPALLALKTAAALDESSAASLKNNAATARNNGQIAEAARLEALHTKTLDALFKKRVAISRLERDQAVTNREVTDALGLTEKALEDVASSATKADKALKFSPEQIKELEKALKRTQGEADRLKATEIELKFGKGAAQEFENLQKLKQVVKDINAAEGSLKLFQGDDKIIDKISSAKEIIAEVAKSSPEVAKTLLESINLLQNQSTVVANNLDLIKDQERVFKSIVTSIKNLSSSLLKQRDEVKETRDIEEQFADSISESTNNFDKQLRVAERVKSVRIEQAKIEAQIVDIERQITNSVDEQGKKIKLDPTREKELRARIADLSKQKLNLIVTIDAKKATDDFNEFLLNTLKGIESLRKKFNEDIVLSQQQIDILKQYNKDLDIGVDFAEQRRAVKEKELEIDNQIRQIQVQIDNASRSGQGLSEDVALLTARLIELKKAKETNALLDQRIIELATAQTNKIKQGIVEVNKEITTQLALIEERGKLFKDRVLVGDFNAIQEKISLFTSSLENLIKIRTDIETKTTTGLIISEADLLLLDEARKGIDALSESLKALNFVKGIQDSLNTVSDAIENAITDGVRGVIEGTKTIKELFREMGQNIFLDFAKLNAKNAIDELRKGLNNLGESLAQTDFFKNIAKFFNIDLNKLNIGNPLTNATVLNTKATASNTALLVKLDGSIQALLIKLSGFSGLGAGLTQTPIIPGTTDFLGGVTDGLDFEKIAQDIKDGTTTLTEVTDQSILKFFNAFQGEVTTGIESVTTQSTGLFGGFFDDLGSLIQTGIESIKGFFSEGGGGSEIFSSILSGIGSLFGSFSFGASKGGIISGKPSKKDNVIMPLAAGEAVTNSDAVSFYGRNIFDALNSKSLPKDFFDNLSTNGAPSLVEAASQQASSTSQQVGASTIRQVQSNERPISVTVVDKSPKLDPASFKMKPSEVTQIFVDGIRNDRVIRKVIREDLKNGGI